MVKSAILRMMIERLSCLVTMNVGAPALYNQYNRQFLNCEAAYILADLAQIMGDEGIKRKNIPKLAICAAFKTAYSEMELRENYILNEETKQILLEKTGEEFANFICEGFTIYEECCYRAAMLIAEYFELQEVRDKLDVQDFKNREIQILECLDKFYDIPMIEKFLEQTSIAFKLMKKILKETNGELMCHERGCRFHNAVMSYFDTLAESEEEAVKCFAEKF